MAISEQSRHHMYLRLEQVLGAEEAATLMEHLPPVGWADVATKHDLRAFAAELRGEMAELRGDLRAEMSQLRGDVGDLRGELGGLRGEIRLQTRNLFLSLVGLQMTAAALAVAVSRVA